MMKRWGILVVATALVALTGCSAPVSEPPAATVTVTETPTESAAPAAAKIAATPTPSDRSSDPARQKEYLDMARLMMLGFSLNEDDLSDKTLLTEGRKICAQGEKYVGIPKITKIERANKSLIFTATTALC